MNCETARQLLPMLDYGELSFEEEDKLEQHLASCAGCAGERAALSKMGALLEEAAPGLPPGLLARNRRAFASAMSEERAPRRGAWRSWLTAWAPVWKPAGAMALFVLGFGAARMPQPTGVLARWQDGDKTQIARVRTVDGAEGGQVRVVFDEVRPREVRGTLDNAMVRQALLAAMENEDPALKVESLELLRHRTSGDDEIRTALVTALQNDRNSGVRLKALEGLKGFRLDGESRHVLCNVLLTDESPAVRAMALDLLTGSREPEVAGALQELVKREQDGYVRERSQRMLTAMKASAGTF
jgi:hypothetical protein